MKNRLLLLISFFLLPFLAFAQETIKVKDPQSYYPYLVEYYVLKSAQKTKHGSYKRTLNGKIIEYGSYKNGLKDSVWVSFSDENGSIVNRGVYTNGLKTGIWESYNPIEKLKTWYNYDTNELLKIRVDNEEQLTFEIKTENGIEKVKLDQPPLIINSNNPLTDFQYQLASKIKYPTQALRKGTHGTVFISFYINEAGVPEDYNIEKGVGDGLDETALNAVKSVKDAILIPGSLNGEKVKAKYILPVGFHLR